MAASERREITLTPEDFQFTDRGELMVRSERVEQALRLAGPEGTDPDLARPNVEVTVSVSVSF